MCVCVCVVGERTQFGEISPMIFKAVKACWCEISRRKERDREVTKDSKGGRIKKI